MDTTSGIETFTPPSGRLVLAAYNLIQVRPTALTQEHYDYARDAMNFLLSDWSNKGVNLWSVDLQTVPLVQGMPLYNVPPDTVEILDVYVSNVFGSVQNDRILTSISRSEYASYPNKNQLGTPTTYWYNQLAPAQIYPEIGSSPIISITGDGQVATLTYSGATALPIGSTILIQGSVPITYNGANYVIFSSVSGSIVTVQFTSLETNPQTVAGTISVATQPGPQIILYQVPDGFNFQYLRYYRLRQNQVAGLANGQLPEITYPWHAAFVHGLAHWLSMSWAPQLEAQRKASADETYRAAAGRNIERAPTYIVPQLRSFRI